MDSLGVSAYLAGWAIVMATIYRVSSWLEGTIRRRFKEGIRQKIRKLAKGTGWASSFTEVLDSVFGPYYASWRCISRAALLSFTAFVVLSLAFLGTNGLHFPASLGLPWWVMTLLFLLVNATGDYLSLLESRWVFCRMGRATSAAAPAYLLADFAATLGISYLSVVLGFHAFFSLVTRQLTVQSWSDLVPSRFEVLSALTLTGWDGIAGIYFYSGFSVTVAFWAYCLSGKLVQLFAQWLDTVWDIDKKPISALGLSLASIATVGFILFAIVKSLGPSLPPPALGPAPPPNESPAKVKREPDDPPKRAVRVDDDPRPGGMEWSFWAYYGKWRDGQFQNREGPSFFVNRPGRTQEIPERGTEVEARKSVNVRKEPSPRAERLNGKLCPGDKVSVEEVRLVTHRGFAVVWIRATSVLHGPAEKCR